MRVGRTEDAHMLLPRGDETRHELHWHHDPRADRSAHNVIALGLANLLLGERHHLAEGEREIERRVRDRTEVRVGAWAGGIFGNDGEVDLFALWVAHASVLSSTLRPPSFF